MTWGDTDRILEEAETLPEFKMKMQLSGYSGSCIGYLVNRIFEISRCPLTGKISSSEEDERMSKLEAKALKLLESVDNEVDIERYIANKEEYSKRISEVFQFNQVAMYSYDFNNPEIIRQINTLVRFTLLIHSKDPMFVKNLRTKTGNNLLMLLSDFFRFRLFIDFQCKNPPRDATRQDILDCSTFITQHMTSVFRLLIVDCECDPYEKNYMGICFSDYIANPSLRKDIGIDKDDEDDADLSGSIEDKTGDQNNELSGNTANLLP